MNPSPAQWEAVYALLAAFDLDPKRTSKVTITANGPSTLKVKARVIDTAERARPTKTITLH